MPEFAGRSWCSRWPTSKKVDALAEPFRSYVTEFLGELDRLGCEVVINATRRPEQRAWLMHWAWRVARGEVEVGRVPVRSDIPIAWTLEGAKEMVETYDLVVEPALTSRHIQGLAIDMRVDRFPGTDAELYQLGESYKVRKLLKDPPHWSIDGR